MSAPPEWPSKVRQHRCCQLLRSYLPAGFSSSRPVGSEKLIRASSPGFQGDSSAGPASCGSAPLVGLSSADLRAGRGAGVHVEFRENALGMMSSSMGADAQHLRDRRVRQALRQEDRHFGLTMSQPVFQMKFGAPVLLVTSGRRGCGSAVLEPSTQLAHLIQRAADLLQEDLTVGPENREGGEQILQAVCRIFWISWYCDTWCWFFWAIFVHDDLERCSQGSGIVLLPQL